VITVSILGGLGNQMFQYAAAKALASRYGVELIIDQSAFRSYALRSFLLDRLQVPEAAQSMEKSSIDTPVRAKNFAAAQWLGRTSRVLNRFGVRTLPQPRKAYTEPSFQFDPTFFALGSSISLYGYFQSERYFIDIADRLRDSFRPRDALGAQAQAIADRIARSDLPVSIHIRRGDYVKSAETARVHGVLDRAYYRKALHLLQGALASPITVFVFSDDSDEAEAILDFIPRNNLVHVRGDPDRSWEDMALMAQCRHHVVANSSFSWWGAWLNPSSDKIVIAPRQWFTAGELRQRNTCDLYPPDWILI
jgi:Glycosyl transferase family 11